MKNKQKIGLVLSGGAIRGVAHLGVLQALDEAGIKLYKISGTSAGAITGALYANGMMPQEILEVIAAIKPYRYIKPNFGASGLLSLSAGEKLLKQLLPHNSFDALKIKLVTTAVNLNQNQLVYFSSGPLIPAVQASMAIPGFFNAVQIDKNLYVDGGILNNFPVEPLQEECDYIIGSSCNGIPNEEPKQSISNTLSRTALLVLNADVNRKIKDCDLLIDPPELGSYGLFDFKKAKEIYTKAYEHAAHMLEKF